MDVIKSFKPSFFTKRGQKNFSEIIKREIPGATEIIVFGSMSRLILTYVSKDVW
jgi:hypothetical protein